MTRVLPSGIEAKTGYLPEIMFPHLEERERHYVVLGSDIDPFALEGPRLLMEDAAEALRIAFRSPELDGDDVFLSFLNWIKTFEARMLGWEEEIEWGKIKHYPRIRFAPPDIEPPFTSFPDDPGPVVTVLGEMLPRNDLMDFTHYYLTNSSPDGPNDPRYKFLEDLKLQHESSD